MHPIALALILALTHGNIPSIGSTNHQHVVTKRHHRRIFFYSPVKGSHESLLRQNLRVSEDDLERIQDDAQLEELTRNGELVGSIDQAVGLVAQIAGAFCAAAVVYRNYLPAFHQVDPSLERTAGVFTTFPTFPALPGAGFLDQVIGTALLLLLIFAITDEFNMPPGANLAPLMIGLVVVAIGMSFGGMHGYAINPARDFGPRLFSVVAGFRNNGLTDGSGAWLVPIAGPLLGGLLGSALYDFGIRRFLRPQQHMSQTVR